ncbi:outer membrane beta-barrel protein [Fulvivirgaceae bacterium BMA10]|uniref:Outer membrane beta-barrel protein n=1 Tax=Splendidivirga corallicola TaxID=3051826 RepID=A0ABT8KLH6_9BACT|nr:outer membrane beta-barrel protein [Fulvivirgaceae bacterium BMA10]
MSITSNKKKLLFATFTKGILAIIFLLLSKPDLFAQDPQIDRKTGLIRGNPYGPDKLNKRKSGNASLGSTGSTGSTPLSFGLKGGTNLTDVRPEDQFSVFSFTEVPNASSAEKQYFKLSDNRGFHFGFIARYAVTGQLSVALEPTFSNMKYSYVNNYTWVDFENNSNSLELNYEHNQTLNYIEIPLLIRYNLLNSFIKPFVHGGGFYGRLLSATKKINVSGTDYAAGNTQEFSNSSSTLGVDDLYIKTHLGLIAGGGLSYQVGPAAVELSANYKIGMNNVVNEANRLSDDTITGGNYDVLDNTKLRNIEISLGLVFSL